MKILLLTGKVGKKIKFLTFCLHDRRNSRHFFKLGAWREGKTRACLLRFFALKLGAWREAKTRACLLRFFALNSAVGIAEFVRCTDAYFSRAYLPG